MGSQPVLPWGSFRIEQVEVCAHREVCPRVPIGLGARAKDCSPCLGCCLEEPHQGSGFLRLIEPERRGHQN